MLGFGTVQCKHGSSLHVPHRHTFICAGPQLCSPLQGDFFCCKKKNLSSLQHDAWGKRLHVKQRSVCYACLVIPRNVFCGLSCAGSNFRLVQRCPGRAQTLLAPLFEHCVYGLGASYAFFLPSAFSWSWLCKWGSIKQLLRSALVPLSCCNQKFYSST